MEEILSKLKISIKDRTLEISGNYKSKAALRAQLCQLLNIPEDSRFDNISFTSIIPDTPLYKRAIHHLSLCLDVPQMNADPESIIDFHADWIRKDLTPPPVEEFNKLPLEIPYMSAAFLIETFCSNQPSDFSYQLQKQYLMKRTILTLNLLAPLPVAFQFIPEKSSVLMTFADTPSTTAQQILNQVKLSLNLFNTVRPFSLRFVNVCPEHHNNEFFAKLSKDLNCVFLVNSVGKDPNTGLITFDFYVLPSQPGKDFREKLIQNFKETFGKFFLAKHCPRCNKYFPEISASNDECGIFEHEGEQIPFDDGKMEHVEPLPDGTSITLVKYTCCGEVSKDEPPPEYMKFDDLHLPEDPPGQYSSFALLS